jgi:OmpA family
MWRRILWSAALVGGLVGLTWPAIAQEPADPFVVLRSVQFVSGSSRPKDAAESQQALRDVSSFLAQNREITTLRIEGHTSNRGTPESCLALSRDRAVAIRNALLQLGVEGERVVAVAVGNEKPIEDNATGAGRARNDRVELRVAPGGAPALATDDAVRPKGDDPRVGIVDQWGGFYARDGSYYDRFGGHYDRDGYYDPDGSFKSRCGYRYDAKSKNVLEPDGSKYTTPRSARTPHDKIRVVRAICAVIEASRRPEP